MRRFALVTLLSLAALPGLALAQSTPNAPPPGPDMMGGPGMMDGGPGDGGGPQAGGWHHHGPEDLVDLLNKFYAANTSHDGHLTLAQAKTAGLQPVVDHFADIDTKHLGYVTFYDIEAWHLDDMAKHLEDLANHLRAQD
jgi:hypothetical protein